MFKKDIYHVVSILPQKIWKLEEVKNFLRISHDYDDELIKNLIETAINAAENFTGLSIKLKEIEYITNKNNQTSFYFKFIPIIRLKKVAFKKENIEQVLSEGEYYLNEHHWAIYLKKNLNNEDLIIKYEAGYEENLIPGALKHGILLHVAEMYEKGEESSSLIRAEIKNLYFPYRQLRI